MFFKKKKNMSELKIELKQKKICELISTLLDSDTEIHFAPISNEYFIVDKEKQISVWLSDRAVKISNHQYLYEVTFKLSLMEKYMNKAKNKVEEKTTKIKKDLFKNEVDLIDKIKNLYDKV